MSTELFEEFLADETAWEFYRTGPPGSGKTYGLAKYVQHCIDNNIPYLVCAHTHKACNVLREALPTGVTVKTLHSFLKKRPTINSNAAQVAHIEISSQFGIPEQIGEKSESSIAVLFIDELSQVGEQDLMSLREMQDSDYDGVPTIKIVWIGDPYQLPPVKDMEAVIPKGKYWEKLTRIYRSNEGNKLQDTVYELIAMIDGDKEVSPLERHDTFRLSKNLVQDYLATKETDKVLLTYTNKQVQSMNFKIAGKTKPEKGDLLFCNTVNRYFKFIEVVPKEHIIYIDRLFDSPLYFNSKFRTLEFLLEMDVCDFYRVEDEDGEQFIYAVHFGTFNYKQQLETFGADATRINREIETKHKGFKASQWAQANAQKPLARKRSLAWRRYLTFKEVACMDFSHVMTIHKSQGSSFKEVYLDAQDLYKCAERNMNLYLRLYLVALSRARNFVVTN